MSLHAGTSAARSLDPVPSCSVESRRVEFSDLVFCWPVASNAPEFKFEILDQMAGSQWFVEGRPASEAELVAISKSRNYEKPHVLTVFSIASLDNPVLRAFGTTASLEQVRDVIELRKNEASAISVALNEGDRLGMQVFEFRKVNSGMFAASRLLSPKSGPPELIEYWVSMTAAGNVDFVMTCTILGRTRNCGSQFLLSNNLVRVGVSLLDSAEPALHAFEIIRDQIRSYVVWPELDQEER